MALMLTDYILSWTCNLQNLYGYVIYHTMWAKECEFNNNNVLWTVHRENEKPIVSEVIPFQKLPPSIV